MHEAVDHGLSFGNVVIQIGADELGDNLTFADRGAFLERDVLNATGLWGGDLMHLGQASLSSFIDELANFATCYAESLHWYP